MKDVNGRLVATGHRLKNHIERYIEQNCSLDTEVLKQLHMDGLYAICALMALSEIVMLKPQQLRHWNVEDSKSEHTPAIDGRVIMDILRQHKLLEGG